MASEVTTVSNSEPPQYDHWAFQKELKQVRSGLAPSVSAGFFRGCGRVSRRSGQIQYIRSKHILLVLNSLTQTRVRLLEYFTHRLWILSRLSYIHRLDLSRTIWMHGHTKRLTCVPIKEETQMQERDITDALEEYFQYRNSLIYGFDKKIKRCVYRADGRSWDYRWRWEWLWLWLGIIGRYSDGTADYRLDRGPRDVCFWLSIYFTGRTFFKLISLTSLWCLGEGIQLLEKFWCPHGRKLSSCSIHGLLSHPVWFRWRLMMSVAFAGVQNVFSEELRWIRCPHLASRQAAGDTCGSYQFV